MAECLEESEQEFTNKSIALQLIDLAEKEEFNYLELSDINFQNGVIFKRLERLDKIKKITIKNTNINNLSKFPPNIEEILIRKGEICIANFILIPNTVTNISIINNKISEIIYINRLLNLVYLDLSQNNLSEIPPLPENLLTFIATHNKILEISNLNSKLVELNLSNNLITECENIPYGIESINLSRNFIKIIDLSSFNKLKVFKGYSNHLNLIIGPISKYIEVFDVFNNYLVAVPDIGEDVKEIDLSDNNLKVLPKFGNKVLERIDITKNPLLKISDDEIIMLEDINKQNKSLTAIFDQFDVDNVLFDSSSSEFSSESELGFNLYDNYREPVHNLNILDFLSQIRTNQKSPTLIRGKEITKRRSYEM